MRTTVTFADDLAAYVDENRTSPDDSDAQAVRDAVSRAMELEEEIATLESRLTEKKTRINDLEREVEQLKNEKQAILNQRKKNTKLVRYAEQNRTIQERKHKASIVKRVKWWFTGMKIDHDEED